jgi:uncharacterized protein
MMRVVLDTNIVVSGWLWSGAPRRALQIGRSSQVQLIASEATLDELRDVIHRSKFANRLQFVGKTAEELIQEYLGLLEIVDAVVLPPVILADPDDDVILACGVGGSANVIVTGDEHLLSLRKYGNVLIQDIHQFLASFEIS